MKATGIVRRIDDLGRVVIPKELRRMMRIAEGDPLEIFTTTDNQVILQKYHEEEPEKNGLAVEPSSEEEKGIKVTLRPYDGDKVFLTLSKSAYDLLYYLKDCGYIVDTFITEGHNLEIVDFLEKGD